MSGFEIPTEDLQGEEVKEDSLQRLRNLSEKYAEQGAAVEKATAALQKAKEEFNKTRLEDLPDLMIEVGLNSLTLLDGSEVELRREINAAITEAKRPAALKWLIEHGFGGLIKTEVLAKFAPDRREDAVLCAHTLSEFNDSVTMKEAVHPATLKSFVKEQMQAGNEIPMDLFGVHPYHEVKLKRAK